MRASAKAVIMPAVSSLLLGLCSLGVFPDAAWGAKPANAAAEVIALGAAPDGQNKVVISPDGSRAAWPEMSGSRWTVNVDGKPGPKFDEIVQDPGIQFSDDGKQYAYLGRRGDAQVLVHDGKEIPIDGKVLKMLFTPQAGHLVYVLQGGAVGEAAHTLLHAGRVVLNGQPGPEYVIAHTRDNLFVSADGKRIAYFAAKGSSAAAGSDDAQEGKSGGVLVVDGKEVLENLHGVKFFQFSQDSAHYACVAVMPPDPAQRAHPFHVVVDGELGPVVPNVGVLKLGSDKSVAYTVYSNERGSKVRVIVGDKEYSIEPPKEDSSMAQLAGQVVFSPDAKRFAYVHPVDLGKVAVVVDGKRGFEYSKITDLAFTPDSKHYAYVAGQGILSGVKYFVVLDGEESQAFTGGSQAMPTALRFSDDGHVLAAMQREDRQTVVMLDGKESKPYGTVMSAVLSPAGGRAAFIAHNSDQQLFVIDGKEVTFDDKKVRPAKVGFSPDGKRVAYVIGTYTTQHNSQLVVDGDKWPTYPVGFHAGPFFSPDSKSAVYFTDRQAAVFNGRLGPQAGVPFEIRRVIATTPTIVSENVPILHFLDDGSLQYFAIQDKKIVKVIVSDKAGQATGEVIASDDSGQGSGSANAEQSGEQEEELTKPVKEIDKKVNNAEKDAKKKIKGLKDRLGF